MARAVDFGTICRVQEDIKLRSECSRGQRVMRWQYWYCFIVFPHLDPGRLNLFVTDHPDVSAMRPPRLGSRFWKPWGQSQRPSVVSFLLLGLLMATSHRSSQASASGECVQDLVACLPRGPGGPAGPTITQGRSRPFACRLVARLCLRDSARDGARHGH